MPPKIIGKHIQKMHRQSPLTKQSELKDLLIKWLETTEITIGDMRGRKSNPEPWIWIKIDNVLYHINADSKRDGVEAFIKNEENGNPWVIIPTGRIMNIIKVTNDDNAQPIPRFYMYMS